MVFYRPPACVRPDFNLLDFFDVPAAFGCIAPTTDGFSIWAEGGTAPIQQKLHGLGAVPVWFVLWPELEAAIADDDLTIVELAARPSLIKGTATFYEETLHPYGGAVAGKIEMVGSGVMEDGRGFQFSATTNDKIGGLTHVRVVFR